MKKTLVFAIVAGVMWISSAEVCAVDYYVDATGGNDNSDGQSEATAWKTIVRVNEEISELQNNTTIRFKRGEIWTNDETLGFRNGHSIGWPVVNGITFEDYGAGEKPKFDGNSQQPIHINSENRLSNLTIRSINCDGTWHTDVSGSNIYVRKVAGLTVDGLEADGHSGAPNVNAKNGMSVTECNGDIVIKNCVLQNWGPIDLPVISDDYQAISLLTWPDRIQPSSVKIHDNVLHHVNADCLQARNIKPTGGEDSFEIYNNIGYHVGENIFDFKSCSYIDLHHNTMYLDSPVNPGGSGGGGGGQSAMVFHTASPEGEWPCEYVKIRENYIYDWPGVGLGLTGTTPRSAHFYVYRNYVKDVRQPVLVGTMEDVHIFDNIIESTSNTPVGYDGYDRNGIYLQSNYNDVFIYNNLIYSDAGHDYGIYIRSPEYMLNMSVTIKNNIFYTTSGNISDFSLFWNGTKDINEAPAISHNLYYNPGNTNRVKWFRWPDTITYDSTEQTAWRNAGHPGALFADPLFVHQATGNFALQPTSPAIDAGTNLGSPYNLGLDTISNWPNNVSTLDQNNCGIGWEIGAYVFAGILHLPIDQSGWSVVFVDSEETEGEDGRAINSFDGDPCTFWHTEWPENPPHPHEIQIDLGGFYDICGFRQLPRQGEYPNGMIKDYEFYVSGDSDNWGPAIASGTFVGNQTEKTVSFDCKLGRCVRLVALSEVNDGPWTSMAELNILAVQPDTDINNDGKVNIEDFAVMAAWWDDNGGCVEPDWCGGADFNMSGAIDFSDLAYFVENWLRQTPVNAPQATVDWHEDFEGETLVVDEQWPDCGCYGQDETWYHGLFWPTDYCYDYIEDDYNDRSSPDSGGKYWSHYSDWIEEATKSESQRSSYILANDTAWDGCNEMKVNDDTEYWIGWSYYIPSDYYEEYYGHAVGQSTQHITNAIAWSVYYGGSEYGHNSLYIQKQYIKGRIYHNGVVSHPRFTSLGPWSNFKGTWIDFVLHFIWHDTDDADAITELYINGAQMWSYSGVDNLREVATEGKPGLNVPLLYNTVTLGDPTSTWCRWFDENGDVENIEWRHIHIDEFRLTEGAKGIKNYCHVAPPVWSHAPDITFPENGGTGLNSTFTAQFDGYSDHRTDAQNCFAGYRMNMQVDENGGDWTSLVYDSGEVSTGASHIVSGLAAGTSYQMRVRHSSYCSARSTEHWGAWSDIIIFTTSD